MYVGLDATRTPRGVIVVTITETHLHEIRLLPTVAEALAATEDAAARVIDLPLTHDDPEGRRGGRRKADEVAAERVGPRAKDLNPAPPPILWQADDLDAARAEARERGWPTPTKRLWTVRERILRPPSQRDLHEGRPELSFQLLNEEVRGHGHLVHPPHYWSGLHERLGLLHQVHLRPTRSFGGIGRMNPEDVVAATALAWTARRITRQEAERFPKDEEPGHASLWA